MNNLLDFLQGENHLFFEALGTEHVIDGRSMTIIVDNDALKRREDRSGVNLGELMYFAQAGDFNRPPKVGERQMFDGRAMTIEESTNDCGLLRIILSQNTG